MRVHIQFIDSKGFIHFREAKTKAAAIRGIKGLKTGTEIHWTSRSEVIISQQYLEPQAVS